jgi:hypothetical protein
MSPKPGLGRHRQKTKRQCRHVPNGIEARICCHGRSPSRLHHRALGGVTGTFFRILMIEAARFRFMMVQLNFRRPEDL